MSLLLLFAGNNSFTMTIDPATVTAAGQDVLLGVGMAISQAGAVSISGQIVLATLGMVISTSAMVTVTGQEVNLWPRVVSGPLFIRKQGAKPAVYWRGRTRT